MTDVLQTRAARPMADPLVAEAGAEFQPAAYFAWLARIALLDGHCLVYARMLQDDLADLSRSNAYPAHVQDAI